MQKNMVVMEMHEAQSVSHMFWAGWLATECESLVPVSMFKRSENIAITLSGRLSICSLSYLFQASILSMF